jgi:hypothetical protein
MLAGQEGEFADHPTTVKRFRQACMQRQSSDTIDVDGRAESAFQVDVLKLRSLGRKIAFEDGAADSLDGSAAHPFKVFEFDDTMANDELQVTTQAGPRDLRRVHPQARLSPVDCQLVSEFVPIAE